MNEQEPDQIDMMDEGELRTELRKALIEISRLTELKDWLFDEWIRFFTAMDKLKL